MSTSMDPFRSRSLIRTVSLVLCISLSLHITDAQEPPADPGPACNPPFKTTGLPRFEARDCKGWNELKGFANVALCGYVVVAQDRRVRGKAAGEVRMPVVQFCSRDRRNKDNPIVHLHGGPGASSLPFAEVGYLFSIVMRRDIVLYDQRGGLLTQPALKCSSLTAECVKNLTNEGIPLDTFTVKEQAKDIEDIRLTLGVKKLNLWGASYGTELALQFSRDFPESTRSLLLETSYWPEFGVFLANSAKAFDTVTQRVLKNCEENLECSRAFPRLRDSVDRILNFTPPKALANLRADLMLYLFAVFNTGTVTYRRKKSPAPLFITLLDKAIAKDLANKSIDEIDGNAPFKSPEGVLVNRINKTINPGTNKYVSQAASRVVLCSSENSLYTDHRYERVVGKTRSRNAFEAVWKAKQLLPAQRRNTCALLPNPSCCPFDTTPVSHDIPTLVMSGTYDAVTPMEIGLKITQSLSNARHMQVDGWGHGILINADACAMSSYLALLETSDMKKYKEPSCVRERKLEFFTNTSFLEASGSQ